jgi:hypothetical protein
VSPRSEVGAKAEGGAFRAVALAFLLVTAATQMPYAVAILRPPPGYRFIGSFYYPDDVHNYMSYAQQAEDGALLFRNKLVDAAHAPALLNPEWLGVGLVSRALGGGRLFVAWRVLALVSALAFFVAAWLALRTAGLPAPHALPALLLVSTGGGLGGILHTFFGRELRLCYDLYAGLFPALELLANPHFVTGTVLLLLALVAFARGRKAAYVALGSVLGLVRPYDLVLLVGITGVGTLAVTPWRRWLAELLPLLGFAPVVGYLYWLFYANPAFAFYTRAPYAFPTPAELGWALGPAALLAALAYPGAAAARDDPARRMRAQLLAWAAAALLVALLRPVHFSLQFMVGVGFPLLALAALGLARFRPAATLAAAALCCTTLVAGVRMVSRPQPFWFTPVERAEVVDRLRATCRPGDRVFAPQDIGLFAFGTTRCRAFVSHGIAPLHGQRMAQLAAFVTSRPEARQALLDDAGITLLVLPGAGGVQPAIWLPEGTSFRRLATVGHGPSAWTLYRREGGPSR